MIKIIEDVMYQLSDFFMAPVLFILVGLFIYSLFAVGAFFAQTWQRKIQRHAYKLACNTSLDSPLQRQNQRLSAYPLLCLAQKKPLISLDEIDVAALKILEPVRNVSRLAPMLGLIATMIPMGPALKSLADGNVQGISDNLIVAFSAVIFGLVIASLTFWIASVKKRWLAEEIIALSPVVGLRDSGIARQGAHCETA